ncbi:MAG: AmmeMemoRadiSam system protein B [Candidatus Eisenbacteria bacterium]
MSDESRPPSRIILPGGGKPGGLVGPDGRPLFSEPADAPPEERLPTHPRLRAVELQEANEGGRSLVVLVDPSGVAPQALAIAAEAMPVLLMLDGSVALEDLIDLVTRETGDPRAGDSIRTLVEELDRRLFLESPRYEAALAVVREEYRARPAREAALAGLSYPEDRAELESFLATHEATARSWRSGAAAAPGVEAAPAAPAGGAPRALAAPHIDLRRGGPVVARAFLELEDVPDDARPDVVFVFGTGHLMVEEPFAVTAKSFETPLGLVETDAEVVAALAAACGPSLLHEELAHRDEHSIEFQVLELKRRFGDRAFRIVPVLAGGFGGLVRYERRPAEEPRVEALVGALRAEADRLAAAGKRALFVAGVDLSHVGARFGDPGDLTAEALAAVEQVDRAALAAAVAGDAEGWFDAIAAGGDATRICGFAPMYVMLRASQPGAGRLLAYEQSIEEGGSMVSYASIAWP